MKATWQQLGRDAKAAGQEMKATGQELKDAFGGLGK